jgi:hypothetical protein
VNPYDLTPGSPDLQPVIAAIGQLHAQEVLYEVGKLFRVLIWEGALHALICPREVMAGQLDRLVGLIGMSTVELGLVPLGAPMPLTPKHGFWIFDEERVIVETINTELQYDSADDVALYGRVWDQLAEAAAYGPRAHRLIARARAQVQAA